MKLPSIKVLLLIACVPGIAWLCTVSDEYHEVNAMTGATRSRTRYAYLWYHPWKYKTTEVAESADRQGIDTARGWQLLSLHSNRLFYASWGCSRAPAAYLVGNIGADDLPDGSTEAFDRFVSEFAGADESTRKDMIHAVGDGSYRPGGAGE